ncbi:MAG: hypothetical protein ACRC18_06300 [Cetobacterium sp.]
MIRLKEIDSEYNLTLHKMNGLLLSEIDSKYMNSISKAIVDVDKIELSIPKYVYNSEFKRVINPIYNYSKHERLINLNDKETYVIRNISGLDGDYKNITAESREVILKKMDLKFEDIGFRLTSSDEDKDIYNLNDYMYEETGWKFGHIDNKVKFQSDGTTEKMRWQESVDGYWYDYLTKTVAEQFECIVIFDSYNKLVNLYDVDEFGGGIKLCLSNDNYMQSLEDQSSSSDIVTRLRLEGNEGLSIKEGNPSGVDYIENYSYFMDNEEMSPELIQALITFNEMVKKRTITWNELIAAKNEKQKTLLDKKVEMLQLISEIKYQESLKKAYETSGDTEKMVIAMAEITKLRDKEVLLDNEITALDDEIDMLQSSIDEIVLLCQKPTATDDDGNLIFNEELLDELKNYTYTDTFSDDAYLEIEDLVSVGERVLDMNCKPTSTWNVGVTDFTSRIIDNNFRQHFKGVLQLGDIIILENEDKYEEFVFLTGYTKSVNDKDLKLTLCNKKVDRNDLLRVSDIFTDAKKAAKLLKSKRYLLVQQEKNRINLNYNKGGN